MIESIPELDDRGVSPVIGVILMVAITVILAAVIGTFVLGMAQPQEEAPRASLTMSDHTTDFYNGTGEAFDITHDSGDAVDVSSLRIIVREKASNQIVVEHDGGQFETGGASVEMQKNGVAGLSAADELRVGDVVTLNATSSGPLSDNTKYRLTVIHKPSDTTVSAVTVRLT